ncbi:MAG: VRR-NUC domain-containing protein [Candidatus Makaraimicrobium thalassicum]|nr:MAG: VRR-NUC domain-containing protein [Candidatus Omnitrophota bacterium]
MASLKESEVQTLLLRRLRDEFPGIYVRKIHQTQFSHNGIPDLVGCLNGMFFAIEVKKRGGKLSALQQRELDFILESDGIGLICWEEGDITRVIDDLRIYL